MALSSKSQTYSDIKSTLSGIKAEKGSITKEDVNKIPIIKNSVIITFFKINFSMLLLRLRYFA